MKEFDPWVFVSVFQEMLGPALWLLVAIAVLIVIGFIVVVARDRGLSSRRLVWSEILGLLGGMAAVLVMQAITHSRLADIGGPVDVMLVALIWLAGAIGTAMLAYLALSLATAGRSH
jgi:hypothetical protein